MALSCRTLQIYVPIRQFFYDLIHPDYSAVTDVYVLMFLADTVDFIIIVFGFWAFGVGWPRVCLHPLTRREGFHLGKCHSG